MTEQDCIFHESRQQLLHAIETANHVSFYRIVNACFQHAVDHRGAVIHEAELVRAMIIGDHPDMLQYFYRQCGAFGCHMSCDNVAYHVAIDHGRMACLFILFGAVKYVTDASLVVDGPIIYRILNHYQKLLRLQVSFDRERALLDHALSVSRNADEAQHRFAVDNTRCLLVDLAQQSKDVLFHGLSAQLRHGAVPQRQWFADQIHDHHGCYFDESSDDSDSEDEALLYADDKTLFTSQRRRLAYLRRIEALHSEDFWFRTRKYTLRQRGFRDQLIAFADHVRLGQPNQKIITQEAKRIVRLFTPSNLSRAMLTYDNVSDLELQSIMDAYNASGVTPEGRPVYILGARGIHYLQDRWHDAARRYHRGIDERGRPLYSESLLKTLPRDYYTYLDATLDKQLDALSGDHHGQARSVSCFFSMQHDSAPVIAMSVRYRRPYLYNSVAHALQDTYSNHLSQFMAQLIALRRRYPHSWGKVLANAFNPNVSIGLRISHALKYAFGQKAYHGAVRQPSYHQDGWLAKTHVGKTYLCLIPVADMSACDGPNHISQMDFQGQVAIDDHISPEKELTYYGHLPPGRVVDQWVTKFPRLQKAWKTVYLVKYGLDQGMYTAFQRLIKNTAVGSSARHAVEMLLIEWLCVYQELCMLRLAELHAHARGGVVFYLDRSGHLARMPDRGRLFTGGDDHLVVRNQVHCARQLRMLVSKYIEAYFKIHVGMLSTTKWTYVRRVVDFVYTQRMSHEALHRKIAHSRVAEGHLIATAFERRDLLAAALNDVFAKIPSQMPALMWAFNVPPALLDRGYAAVFFRLLYSSYHVLNGSFQCFKGLRLVLHESLFSWMMSTYSCWKSYCLRCFSMPVIGVRSCRDLCSRHDKALVRAFLFSLFSAMQVELIRGESPARSAYSLFHNKFSCDTMEIHHRRHRFVM